MSVTERRPRLKAAMAGATPNEICGRISLMSRHSPIMTYQICERVELLSHETALLSPSRNLAVKSIEEETKGEEHQSQPQVTERVGVSQGVAQGREYRHGSAEACQQQKVSHRSRRHACVDSYRSVG